MILTRRFTAVFFGLAVLNEVIWRFFSTDTWVYFKTFGLTAVLFRLFYDSSPALGKNMGWKKMIDRAVTARCVCAA